MQRRISRLIFVLGILALSVAISRGQTNTLVLPKEALEAFGDSFANLVPTADGPVQQIYAATEFDDVAVDSIWITGIALRFDDPSAAMDATVSRIVLAMGVFEGSMADLSLDMDENLQNAKIVLEKRNFPIVVERPNGPVEFNAKFPFTSPFLYNRQRGQLVLEFFAGSPTGGEQPYDAHKVSRDRGFYVFQFSDGMPAGGGRMVATEFSYLVITSTIDSIHQIANNVQIDFTITGGTPNSVRMEGSPVVTGIFTIERESGLSTISPGKMRATIPITTINRFSRVRLE